MFDHESLSEMVTPSTIILLDDLIINLITKPGSINYMNTTTSRCLNTVSSILSTFCDETCLQEIEWTG